MRFTPRLASDCCCVLFGVILTLAVLVWTTEKDTYESEIMIQIEPIPTVDFRVSNDISRFM